MKLHSRGMSLLQLIVFMVLTFISIGITILIFGQIQKGARENLLKTEAEQQIKLIGIFLKNRLEGTLSFQNLSFRISSSPNLGSRGTGFFVEPDRDFNAAELSGSDRLHLVMQLAFPTKVKMVGGYVPPAASATLGISDPSQNITQLIQLGDLLVFSGVQFSEVIKVTQAPVSLGGGQARISFNSASFENTFIAPGDPVQIRRTYADGDYVYKARIVRVGLDPTTQDLKYSELGVPGFSVIAKKVSRFSVKYELDSDTTRCVSGQNPAPPASPYARNNWQVLNSSGDMSCYKRIRSIKIEFEVSGGPSNLNVVAQAPKAQGEYVFRTNQ